MDIVYKELESMIPMKKAIKTRVDGDFLIVMPENGALQYFNEVAREFYCAIDEEKNIGKIVGGIAEIYDVKLEDLQKDIVELVRELQWNDLILLKEKREGR